MTDTTATELADSLASWADTFARWDDDTHDDGYESFDDMLNTEALEAYADARLSLTTDTIIDTVTVVLGTGGPHVEAVWRIGHAGDYTLHGYWGGQHVTHHATSHAFTDWCESYVDMIDEMTRGAR